MAPRLHAIVRAPAQAELAWAGLLALVQTDLSWALCVGRVTLLLHSSNCRSRDGQAPSCCGICQHPGFFAVTGAAPLALQADLLTAMSPRSCELTSLQLSKLSAIRAANMPTCYSWNGWGCAPIIPFQQDPEHCAPTPPLTGPSPGALCKTCSLQYPHEIARGDGKVTGFSASNLPLSPTGCLTSHRCSQCHHQAVPRPGGVQQWGRVTVMLVGGGSCLKN